MTSAVDPGIITGAPVNKADMVAQLTIIRDEISALQTQFASIGGAGVLLNRTVISGTPTNVDFVLPTGYTSFRVIGTSLFSASAGFQVSMRISRNSGVSYDAGATDYANAYSFQSDTLNAGQLQTSSMLLTEVSPASNPANFDVNIIPGDGAFGFRLLGKSQGLNAAGTYLFTGSLSAGRVAAGRATNIRILGSVAFGNSGVLTLIGIP